MHPAYIDLEQYVDAADQRDEQARSAGAQAVVVLDRAVAGLAEALPDRRITVLRSGSAGTAAAPVVVADLAVDGVVVKLRADDAQVQLWLRDRALTATELAAQLPPLRQPHRFPLPRRRRTAPAGV